MSFTVNLIPTSSLLGALVLATAAIGQAAHAAPTPVEASIDIVAGDLAVAAGNGRLQWKCSITQETRDEKVNRRN